MSRIAVVVVTSVLVGAFGCGDVSPVGHSPFPPDSIVHTVTVFPESATVKIGGQVVLAVQVDAGALVTDRSVAWSSSNSTIASVNTSGIVTPGPGTGVVTITAKSKADTSVKGTSTITVTAAATSALSPGGR